LNEWVASDAMIDSCNCEALQETNYVLLSKLSLSLSLSPPLSFWADWVVLLKGKDHDDALNIVVEMNVQKSLERTYENASYTINNSNFNKCGSRTRRGRISRLCSVVRLLSRHLITGLRRARKALIDSYMIIDLSSCYIQHRKDCTFVCVQYQSSHNLTLQSSSLPWLFSLPVISWQFSLIVCMFVLPMKESKQVSVRVIKAYGMQISWLIERAIFGHSRVLSKILHPFEWRIIYIDLQ